MSDLVDFEELDNLDGGDLRAVFEEVSSDQMLEALIGTPAHMRVRLLEKLSRPSAEKLAAEIDGHEPDFSFEAGVVRAQPRLLKHFAASVARASSRSTTRMT